MKITKYLLIMLFFCASLHVFAQEKLLIGGSGNPSLQIIDKNTKTVEWEHKLNEGEECNTVGITPEGNILYSYKKGAKLIDKNHKVIWDYTVPNTDELQSVFRLNDGGYLIGICGSPARIIELDKNGKERNRVEIDLAIEDPHSQFRQVIQLKNGNYLLPVLATRRVKEINRKGKVVNEFATPDGVFSALELKSGNLVLPCGDGHFYITVDPKTGKELSRVSTKDLDNVSLTFVAQIIEAENGNLMICNWDGHVQDAANNAAQIIEVNPNGKVVWTLNDKKNIGKVSSVSIIKK